MIVGLDPSIRSPGLAVNVNGVLRLAVRLKLSKETLALEDWGMRVDAVAIECVAWVQQMERWCEATTSAVVYERPQIYGVGKSTGDPNDLIALAAIGAAVARELRGRPCPDIKIHAPLPREWQGGTKKRITGDAWDCTRGAKLRVRLTAAELAIVEGTHDAIDAACLALHTTPRALAKRRRAPNSRGSRPRATP